MKKFKSLVVATSVVAIMSGAAFAQNVVNVAIIGDPDTLDPMMSTKDVDILWDIRRKLTLVTDSDSKPDGLLGIIRKADRSFEAVRSGDFRAVNRDGYMVDFIKPLPKKIMQKEPMRIGGPGDLEAIEIRNLHWLISSPKFAPPLYVAYIRNVLK